MPAKRVTNICLVISIFAFFASTGARGQALISARVLSSEGPVEIQRRPQGEAALVKITYRANDELLAGDVIKTLKGGRLVLGLTDGSQAVIGEKTTVEITDLSQSPRTIFNVLRGKTRIKIEKMGGRPNPYKVNTPTAVIAVRGTLFDVFVTEKETRVFVYEGAVAVSSPATPEALILLSPGQRTRVRQARPPEAPTDFRPDLNNDTFKPRPSDGRRNGDLSDERDGDNRPHERPDDRRDRGAPTPSDKGNSDGQKEGQKGGDKHPPGEASPAGN